MGRMPVDFWQNVLASDMAVPDERPLNELTAELVTMLGSTDPVERDEIAYPVLATWLSEGVYDDLLVSFGDSIATGLQVGLGNSGSDSVFRRSFSALVLAECIDRDNRAHLLPIDVVLRWADHAIGWFIRERDVRGWVDGKGWAHTIAHGADLLGVLGASRHLTELHVRVLLDVISERLLTPTDHVFVDGEDDRLAAATLTLVQRNLVDTAQLESWVDGLAAGLTPQRRSDSGARWPTPQARNTSQFLRALHVHLAVGVSPIDSTLPFTEPPACRSDLLLALLRAIPRFTPWLYSPVALANDRGPEHSQA
jgi:Protein of unknown function (DUF2785)